MIWKSLYVVIISTAGIVLLATPIVAETVSQAKPAPTGDACDSASYLEFAKRAEELRTTHRLTAEEFAEFATDPKTIVLDARSQSAFEMLRIVGSKNLPFTSFSEKSLREIIPSTDTRVLIYCRNNIVDTAFDSHIDFGEVQTTVSATSTSEARHAPRIKGRPVGLNIPTYITLYVYGYHNIWELNPVVDPTNSLIRFEGTHFVNKKATTNSP